MIGKKLTCAAAISLALLTTPAGAQWVVTDPGSYMYYVEEIAQMVELVNKAAEQVETLGGVLTQAEKIQSNLTGHYNRAVGVVNRIKGVSEAINRESGGGIFGEARKWGNVGRKIGGAAGAGAEAGGKAVRDLSKITGEDIYADTKEILDEVFTDPRSIDNAEDRHRSLSRRYQIQQGALKEVVARSERTLTGVKDRMQNIEELAAMIDSTANQKDAQDLTNRLLVELLATMTDMLHIAALSNQAEALNNYRGVSESGIKERQKALDTVVSSASSLEDALSKATKANRTYKTFK